MTEYKLEMSITCATGDADHFYNTILMIARGFEIGVIESKLSPIEQKPETNVETQEKKEIEKKVLSLQETAEYLKVSKSTLYKYTADATIPYYKIGQRIFFKVIDLEEWLEDHKVQSHD